MRLQPPDDPGVVVGADDPSYRSCWPFLVLVVEVERLQCTILFNFWLPFADGTNLALLNPDGFPVLLSEAVGLGNPNLPALLLRARSGGVLLLAAGENLLAPTDAEITRHLHPRLAAQR